MIAQRLRLLVPVVFLAACGPQGKIEGGDAVCSAAAPTGLCATGQICDAGTCRARNEAPCATTNPAGACDAGNVCVSGACVSTCADGAQDGDETAVDCGGATCAACVNGDACGLDLDCQSGVCMNSVCANPTCVDQRRDGSETDTDCGGSCPPCSNGGSCGADADCLSSVCLAGTCAAPSCTDNRQDGVETDVDCGGTACPACATSASCSRDLDCQSGVCASGQCAAPSCTDLVKNGTETGKDCGGGCSPCGNGLTCQTDVDCQSGICDLGLCVASACNDLRQDGLETGFDCGGPFCPPCGTSAVCSVQSDCQSGVCIAGQCALPTCTDGVKNGDETGIDCGGSCALLAVPLTCPVGSGCGASADCATHLCDGGQCRDVSCGDHIQNGLETDIDCGGGVCAACASGLQCRVGTDCQSASCAFGFCVAPSCNDHVQNQGEVAVDCGGPCPACLNGSACNVGGDCQSGICTLGRCVAPTCSNAVQDPGETGIDCGGTCAPCPTSGGCTGPTDCQSGVCTNNACAAPTCSDGVVNGGETAVDCGFVACAAGCATGKTCGTDYDCASLSCAPATHLCLDPTCLDGRKNGSETGVDCGGSCGACAAGAGCLVAGDCLTGVCGTDKKCAAPSCSDTVKNGDETGIDCGGTCALAPTSQLCGNGAACKVSGDCQSGTCTTGTCSALHCTDGVINSGETGIDCGGGECAPCAAGGGCAGPSDCLSLVCTGTVCMAPSCTDGVKNGIETDIDCGDGCPPCAAGLVCNFDVECQSGVCQSNRCQAATCSDHVQNVHVLGGGGTSAETGVDCGGPCLACPDLSGCAAPIDCQSGVCTTFVCQPPSCNPADGVKNGNETDVDCGAGGTCPACTAGKGCTTAASCQSLVCTGGTCQAPLCTDTVKNGDETAVDCGGSCPKCADGASCLVGADCVSGACGAGGTCAPASCSNGVNDGTETGIDCGGGTCPPCDTAGVCSVPSDCASKVCLLNVCQAAACGDGVQNGAETAIDCGGGTCSPCGAGATCSVAADCQSGVCLGSPLKCQAPRCGDGVKNGTEACDDGNTSDCIGTCKADCSGTITLTGCGDGVVCGSEQCDLGTGNVTSTQCPYGQASCTLCLASTCQQVAGTTSYCGDGHTDPAHEVCDGADTGTTTCSTVGGTGTIKCASNCQAYDFSACTFSCGNGSIDPGEVCDGTNLNGKTCVNFGSSTPSGLACAAGCKSFDLTNCSNLCGNGLLESGEVCDGADPVLTCPFASTGTATCKSDCSGPDYSACVGACGNGVVDAAEQCDTAALAGASCTTLAVCVGGGNDGKLCSVAAPDCPSGTCTPFQGGSLSCKNNCSFDVSLCYFCGDGKKNGTEQCDTADLGTPAATCVSAGFSAGSLSCSPTCALVTSACTTCGDGVVQNPPELCDGQSLGGKSCTSISACASGTVGKYCTGDGDCGGGAGSCTAGYFQGGSLACSGSCGTYDTSQCAHCPSTCATAGGTCVAGVCQCPLYESLCGASCVNLKTDPSNCGTCGHACTAGQACSAGVCSSTCQLPLKLCGTSCVDTESDSANCGACGTSCATSHTCLGGSKDGRSCTTDANCPVPGKCLADVCIGGACAAATSAGFTTPSKCADGGPPIQLNTGLCAGGTNDLKTCSSALDCPGGTCAHLGSLPGGVSCTGNLAGVSFRWAICSCGSFSPNNDTTTDGFDSRVGPYSPHCPDGTTCSANAGCNAVDGIQTCADSVGAGMGFNGYFSTNSTAHVWGTLWWADTAARTITTAAVKQDLHGGGAVGGTNVQVYKDVYTPAATGGLPTGHARGKLFASNSSLYTPNPTTVGAFQIDGGVHEPPAGTMPVPEPCDCAPSKLIDIASIIDNHACSGTGPAGSKSVCVAGDNNDNLAAGLSPTIFEGNGGRIDLPCGMYYLRSITPGNSAALTIVVHGRTAIFVDGDINANKALVLSLDGSSELDIFVKGLVTDGAGLNLGNPNFPARARLYIRNSVQASPGAGTNAIDVTQKLNFAGNVYAPWGSLATSQALLMYGGMFIGDLSAHFSSTATVHFDTGVVDAGKTCPTPCGNGKLDATEACDGTLLGGQTCQTMGFDGGTLTCKTDCSGFTTTGCFRCGDGVVNGSEQCDGDTHLNGGTCLNQGYPQGGTLACRADCRYGTSGCNYCGDGIVEPAEQCEAGQLGGATCTSLGAGFTAGTLGCNLSTCQFDTTGCTSCGDNVVQWPEQCELGNLAGRTCTSLGFFGGTLACDAATCLYDTSKCTVASTCGDHNVDAGEQCDDGNAVDTDDCRNNCTRPYCGDAFVSTGASPAEQCDGSNLNGKSCTTLGLGFSGGTLACNPSCAFDTSGCIKCGDKVVQAPEQCEAGVPLTKSCQDLGYTGGSLGCNGTSCTFITTGCYSCGDDNAAIDGPEQCDYNLSTSTVNLGGQTCANIAACAGGTSPGKACTSSGDCAGGGTCVPNYFGGGSLGCNLNCTLDSTSCYRCGDGALNPTEACDPGGGSVPAALGGRTCTSSYCATGTNAGRACTTINDCGGAACTASTFAGGTISCTGSCAFDTSGCNLCGNGAINPGEQCDTAGAACTSLKVCVGGSNNAKLCTDVSQCPGTGTTCTAMTNGSGSTAACKSNCTYDLSTCSLPSAGATCGDGVVGGSEQCDLTNLNSATCTSLGYVSGTLACNTNCTFNTTNCCGDGVKGTSEQCDGTALGGATCSSIGQGFTGGSLGCTSTCKYDASACTQCTTCRDCNNQACVYGVCGSCQTDSDCCAPLVCSFGTCTLY